MMKNLINQILEFLKKRKDSVEAALDDIYIKYPRTTPFPVELETEYRVIREFLFEIKKILRNGDNTDETGSDE